jgi:hypothetical protein
MQAWIDKFPVVFAVVDGLLTYIVVCFVITLWSGWALLALRFRLHSKYTGPRWRGQSGQWRWLCNYNNCMIVGADPQGLYLANILPFALFHPRLFIPWSEITYTTKALWFMDGVRYRLGRDLRIPLWLRKKTSERIKGAAGASYPVETLE